MAKIDLFEFTDILMAATRIGFDWNEAHDILVGDEIPPMYEMKKKEYYIGELDEYGWSEDTIKILKAFFKEEKVEEFTLI